jgi:hypothetical protein
MRTSRPPLEETISRHSTMRPTPVGTATFAGGLVFAALPSDASPNKKKGPLGRALMVHTAEGRPPRYSCRNRFANTFASPTMFSIIVYSFGWCATSSIFDQTTAPKPWRLKKAATVPPPIPFGFALTR